MLSLGLSTLPGNVQAQQYNAGTGVNIIIPTGGTASVATGSAIIATDGGTVTGAGITAISSDTEAEPAVSASGAGSLITLTGATTINANGIGVRMGEGGAVNLDAGTVINIGGIESSSAVGVLVSGSATPAGTIGDGLVININGAARTGDNAWIGVATVGASDNLTLNNLTVQGTSADVGAYVRNGAKLTLTNSDITINGSNPWVDIHYFVEGFYYTFVDNKQTGLAGFDGSTIDATNVDITVNSPGGAAVRAQTNMTVNLTGGVFNINSAPASGSSTYGILAIDDSRLNINGTEINVAGNDYHGIRAGARSTLVGNDVSLTMAGNSATGILIDTNSTGTLTDSTIKLTGTDGYGIWIVTNSHATMNGGSLELQGTGGNGVVIQDANSSFTGNSAPISMTGAGSTGVVNSGTATLNDSTITATGSNSTGLTNYSTANLTDTNVIVEGIGIRNAGTAPVLNMSGGSVTSTLNALRVTATNATLNFSNGAVVTGGNGILLDVVNSGNAALTATNGVIFKGDMQAAALANNVTADLSDNTVWTGAARNIGATTVTGGSTWNMTGNSDVASLVLDNSTLAYSAPGGDPAVLSNYKTLTVRGDYTGNGGLVVLNTWLASDNSPTDLLVVQGNTAGSSLIRVDNTGGSGAYTTGNGIMLVNVQGDSAGQFALGNRVAAGAYEYLLFKGGIDGDAGDGNWYLRNTYTPAPTPDDPAPEPVPIVRPEVPTSMVIPPLAIEYGYSMLGTMQDRSGEVWPNAGLGNGGAVYEERSVWCKGKNPNNPDAVIDPNNRFKCIVRVPVAKANGAGNDETRWARSGWARLIGTRGFQEPGNFLRRGPDYNYTFWGVQAGLDVFAREQADGTLDKAGVYVGYGQIASDVKGQLGAKAGTVNMDAYTVGGYWTHYSPNGWYTDAVVQGTWYAADAKSTYGQRIKPDGFGILGSLEAGYAFKLGSGWTLEPQAQIVYQNVSFDNARDSFGFVRFDDGDSLRGRIGARLTKTWNTAEAGKQSRLVTAFLRVNVWHEFLGKTTTSWGSLDGQNMTPFSSYLGGTWGEIGGGVTAQLTDKVNVFATGAYSHSLDGKGREGWDGRLGLTSRW